MPETKVQEEAIPADEEQESPEETEPSESDEVAEEETPAEESKTEETESDEIVDWADIVKENPDIPDGWKDDPDKFFKGAAEALREMKRLQGEADEATQIKRVLRANGYSDVNDFLQKHGNKPPESRPAVSQPGGQPSLLYIGNILETAKQNRTIDEDSAVYLTQVARVVDPVIHSMYQIMSALADQVAGMDGKTQQLYGVTRSYEWGKFASDHKGFDKAELDTLREKHNLESYEQAAAFVTALDPKRFAQITNKIRENVERKNFKKLRMTKAFRGGQRKDAGPPGSSWKEYVGDDGNPDRNKLMSALNSKKITEKEYEQICDTIIEKEYPRKK